MVKPSATTKVLMGSKVAVGIGDNVAVGGTGVCVGDVVGVNVEVEVGAVVMLVAHADRKQDTMRNAIERHNMVPPNYWILILSTLNGVPSIFSSSNSLATR